MQYRLGSRLDRNGVFDCLGGMASNDCKCLHGMDPDGKREDLGAALIYIW